MHTIISRTVPASVVGAGRQHPTPIHNRSSKIIDIADDLKDLLEPQAVDVIETPVAMVPVPESVLRRIRTINRLEGLAILENRKAHLAREDFIITFPLTDHLQDHSLKRARTVNRLEGLAMLERRKALHTEADDTVLAGDLAHGSSLKRIRTINKVAGLEKRERRKARVFGNQLVQTYLAPEFPAHLSTPPPLARKVNAEDCDISEDAKIAYAMWVKHREAQFSGQYSVATQSKASIARVGAIGKKEGLTMLERRRAHSAKGSVIARLHGSLARIGATVKKEGLAILGRRHGRSGGNSLAAPAQSQASSLKRVETISKRERRNAGVFMKQSVPDYFAPECAACLLTPPPLVRHVEDSDVSEDARIAFAMWMKKRIEAAEKMGTSL